MQNPAAHPHGIIFFARTFCIDPGDGEDISYKINHSVKRANLRAVVEQGDSGEHIIVFRAARVCRAMGFVGARRCVR